jgi:hypothetical protein
MEPVGPDAWAMVEADRSGALLVRTSRRSEATDDFFADWADLHRRLTEATPMTVTVQGNARVEGETAGTLRVHARYDVPDTRGPLYELAYARIARNGAACRIAALERAPLERALPLLAVVDGIRDAPGLAVLGARPVLPRPDLGWTLLRGILILGRSIALH